MSSSHITVLLIPAGILAGMLVFILMRRVVRAQTLHRLDSWREHWLSCLPDLLAGRAPESRLLAIPEARETLESLLVDRLQTARGRSQKRLQTLIERCGLLDYWIQMLRRGARWKRLYFAGLLGRMRAAMAVSPLMEALEDPWPSMRSAAVRSLAVIGSPAAGPALLRMLRRGVDIEPNLWLDAAVACVSSREAFVELIGEVEPETRRLAARAVAESKAPVRFESLEKLIRDPDPEVRAQAARALGRTGKPLALPLLIGAVNDREWSVRQHAVAGLAELKMPAALNAVLHATRDPEFQVRQKAASALSDLVAHPADVLDPLLCSPDRFALLDFLSELARAGLLWHSLPLLRDPDPEMRRKATELLTTALAYGNHHEMLYAIDAHPDWRVRMATARLLTRAGDASLAPELERRVSSAPTARQRRVWRTILSQLGSRPRETRHVVAVAV